MKNKFLTSLIVLAVLLSSTVVTQAADNTENILSEKEVYLNCSECIKDNDIELTLCDIHSKDFLSNENSRCGGDVGLGTGPNGNTIATQVRPWYDAPLYPGLGNYYFTTRNKQATNQHSMVGIGNNRSSSNYVTAWLEDGSGRNITSGSWSDLNTVHGKNFYYQINTPGIGYNNSIRLGIESYISMSYTGYCDGIVDYH